MNTAQKLWWRQAQSDHRLIVQLRRGGADECHLLHYLQMATEKLSKAYFWRSGHPRPRTHVGFVRFLKAILDRRAAELDRIAQTFGFGRAEDLENWVRTVQILAYDLQSIALAEARNGPNADYPWPHEAPAESPVDYEFPLWKQLATQARGVSWSSLSTGPSTVSRSMPRRVPHIGA